MGFVVWALVGIALGAGGAEVLRAVKPKFVRDVEEKVRDVVDGVLGASPSGEDRTEVDGEE